MKLTQDHDSYKINIMIVQPFSFVLDILILHNFWCKFIFGPSDPGVDELNLRVDVWNAVLTYIQLFEDIFK